MLFALLFPVLLQAQVPAGELIVRTDHLTATLTSQAGWTITTLEADGTRLVIPAGGQGAVIMPRGGDWQGSGMKGGEQVRSLSATVDGQQVTLALPQTLTGKRISLTKQSSIGKLEHSAQTTFEADLIVQQHSFKVLEDVDLASFYAFIYSVTPSATQWLAQPLEGQELSGELSAAKTNAVDRRVLWVAEYDPAAQKGLLCYLPSLPAGPGAAVRIWDMPAYRKLFVQPQAGKLARGAELALTMVMKPIAAPPAEWQARVRTEASELTKRFPPQQQAAVAAPRVYGEGVPEEGFLTAQTDHYKIVFSAKQAWTIFTFSFDDKPIGHQNGFYGTVLVPKTEGGSWIGTGHTEGGREIVHALKLTVDGQPMAVSTDKTVPGHRIELIKDSTIDKFHATTTITVTDDEVIERQELEATEDLELKLMYLFMHCWQGTTTKWLAEAADGELLRGEFDNTGNEVLKDTRWCAQYEPKMGIAILGYTPRIAHGVGSYTMVWDLERYHKFYTRRTSGGEAFRRGDRLDYTMVVRGVPGETGDWQATQAAVKELKAKYPPQD